MVADLTVPTGIAIHDWSVFDNIVGYIRQDLGQGKLYFAQLNEFPLPSPPCNMSILDAELKSVQIIDGVCHLLLGTHKDDLMFTYSLRTMKFTSFRYCLQVVS